MKLKLKALFLGIICTIIISIPTFAAGYYPTYVPSINVVSKILPSSVKESTAYVTSRLRGEFFAAGELKIINENGKIGVAAKAYMKYPADETYMSIYLDRLDGGLKWNQVAYYEFEFFAKDFPNGMMTPGVEFTISDQPAGQIYRLRGSYTAIKDGAIEGFGPVTDGILIQ